MKYIKHIIKLDEIVNLKQTQIKVPAYDIEQMQDDMLDMQSKDTPGKPYGAYAFGSVDPNDPHIFKKTNFLPTAKEKVDPYYLYIKTCAKYTKSNPFFPRVYGIQTGIDPSEYKHHSFNIEKLVHYNHLSPETLLGICDNIDPTIGDFIRVQLKKQNKKYPKLIDPVEGNMEQRSKTKNDERIYIKTQLISDIANNLGKYLRMIVEGKKTTTNTKLKQALDLILKIIKYDNNFELDIHQNNFMFRGTPNGYQLVLNDPISLVILDDEGNPIL